MVPVGVADEDVDPRWGCRLAQQREAELTYPRAAVEYEEIAVIAPQFDARRVPTVSCSARTGCRNGAELCPRNERTSATFLPRFENPPWIPPD